MLDSREDLISPHLVEPNWDDPMRIYACLRMLSKMFESLSFSKGQKGDSLECFIVANFSPYFNRSYAVRLTSNCLIFLKVSLLHVQKSDKEKIQLATLQFIEKCRRTMSVIVRVFNNLGHTIMCRETD